MKINTSVRYESFWVNFINLSTSKHILIFSTNFPGDFYTINLNISINEPEICLGFDLSFDNLHTLVNFYQT